MWIATRKRNLPQTLTFFLILVLRFFGKRKRIPDSKSPNPFTIAYFNRLYQLSTAKLGARPYRVKTAEILVALVNESGEKPNADIAREILLELQKIPHAIPWVEKVLIVNVNE